MNQQKRIAVLLCLGCCWMGGCGSNSGHLSTEKYYLVATNIDLPYWKTAASGLAAAGREFQVQTEVAGPNTYDPQAEREAFRQAVQKKPAGIMVSAADKDLLKSEIDSALGQGIPVITMDSDAPDSKRLLFIGTNNYQAGLLGGKALADKLNGKGNVVVFTMPNQPNLEERLNGYRAALAGKPQIKLAEVVNIRGDARVAFDTTQEILNKRRKEVDAFVCLEAQSGKEVAEMLNREKVEKTVIAMDTDEETLRWVDQGVIAATIAQRPYTMAYYGAKVLDDLHHHPPQSLQVNFAEQPKAVIPTFIDTGVTLVDKSKTAEFRVK